MKREKGRARIGLRDASLVFKWLENMKAITFMLLTVLREE